MNSIASEKAEPAPLSVRDEYELSSFPDHFRKPTKTDLIEFLESDIESWADGLEQAPWDIHCAVHLIKMLEGGAK